MATIICTDCGDQRTKCPSNTKRCIECATTLAATFWTDKTRACLSRPELAERCGKRYVPLSRVDRVCGDCHGDTAALVGGPRGVCVACRDNAGKGVAVPRQLLLAGLPVCVKCIKDPDIRPAVARLLLKRQAERRAANAVPA